MKSALFLALLAAAAGLQAAGRPDGKPIILFILADDQY